MRVAYFTESLPPNTDGVVKTLVRLVETLQEQNIDFLFFSPVVPDESYSWRDRVIKVKSVPLFLYKSYQVGLPFFEGITRRLDEFSPDIIHICAPSFLGLTGLNYALKNSLPAVTSYHTHFVDYFSYFGLSWLEPTGWSYLQWFHNKCEMTFAPSPSALAELRRRGIQNVSLWQRGIELDRFSPHYYNPELRRSIGAEDKPILLFVGRLINHKDLEDLVEASRILAGRGRDFKLVLVGDGPMRAELEEKLPDAHFTGFLYGKELAQWYASADIFVFPSTTETFGNVILEAFASGIPAVGVAAGGVADIITHHHDGLIAKPKNPRDFASAVERLLLYPHLAKKLGQNARISAQRYNWQEINRQLLDQYQEIIKRKKSQTLERLAA
ncbi:MAG: glycosyltransferase family 1 protein [candidate division KSB1 bacterium]|nr:glycosyltransferase family 1 protein [candidate division KSB1 bacterium]